MKYLARTSFKMRLILIWQLCLSRAREWERESKRRRERERGREREWKLSGLVAWEKCDNTHSSAHKHQYMATECKGSLMDAICFQLKPPFKPPYLTSKIEQALSFGPSWVRAVFYLWRFKAQMHIEQCECEILHPNRNFTWCHNCRQNIRQKFTMCNRKIKCHYQLWGN